MMDDGDKVVVTSIIRLVNKSNGFDYFYIRLNDKIQSCMASNPGKIALMIKLKANKDQTKKKLVQNNFREIFLSCLAKIC